jgi:chromosome segregation ATPase
VKPILARVLLAVSLVALGLGTATAQARIVCWTDSSGQRACGDRVPPEYARGEQQVLDAQGRVVQRRERQRTQEELSAESQARAEAATAAREREEQARFDRYLTQSYSNVDELISMRDRRVELIDARIALAKSSRNSARESHQQLSERRDRVAEAGNPVPERLSAQIAEAEQLLRDNDRRLVRLNSEREQTMAQFDRELARYRVLRPVAGSQAVNEVPDTPSEASGSDE